MGVGMNEDVGSSFSSFVFVSNIILYFIAVKFIFPAHCVPPNEVKLLVCSVYVAVAGGSTRVSWCQ